MEASALQRQRGAILPRSRRLLAALSDDKLVDQVRRGNATAFEVVYDRHTRGILSFCRHMLGSREEAEDAVQQTFASAFTDLQSNDRPIKLKAWLYTIARNRCLSVLRARREHAAELEDLPAIGGLSDQVQQRADLRELLADLRDLPDDQREALVLYEIGDLSQAEVANVIGVEPVKVKALVFQARSTLIENREARDIPCREIREQLATATGGALRRGPLRRHLKACEGCREYRDQVRAQRRALAAILPVVPTLGLKDSVLAGLGFGGGAGGAAAGGAAGTASGTGLLASIGGAGAAKLAIAGVLGAGFLAGGGIAVRHATHGSGGSSEPTAEATKAATGSAKPAATAGGGLPGGTSATPIASTGHERASTSATTAPEKAKRKRKHKHKHRSGASSSAGGDSTSQGSAGSGDKHKHRGRGRGHWNHGNHGSHGGGNGPKHPWKHPQNHGHSHGNSGSDSGSNSAPAPAPAQPTKHQSGSGDGDSSGSSGSSGGGRQATGKHPVAPDGDDGKKDGGKTNTADEAKRLLSAAAPLPE
jgi:RNA polymerase sigma factor (sigma-70 family)